MTAHQKTYIRQNWMTLANMILLLGIAFRTGYTQSKHESNIIENTRAIIKHEGNTSLHMSFEKKIEIFVPRVELDARLSNIEKAQKTANEKQDKIYQLLLTK